MELKKMFKEGEKNMNEKKQDTFALEMFKEVKANAKRWFIIAIVELVIIAGLVAYIFVPVEETTVETSTEQEIENTTDESNSILHQQSNAKVGD